MTARNPSPPSTLSSAWKIHPWAWAALVLSVGCFLVVVIQLGSLFVASEPCRIERRVEPNLSPESAWQPLDPLAAWPVDRPVFDVSVWDDDRHRLALTRMVGQEAERIELSLHFGRQVPHAFATMRWYLDSGIPEYARIDGGSVTVNSDALPSDSSPMVVEYRLRGVRGREPFERRGKVAFLQADVQRPATAGRN